MTVVRIQSNKIVSNEVKDYQVPLEPSCGKNKQTFWPTQQKNTANDDCKLPSWNTGTGKCLN